MVADAISTVISHIFTHFGVVIGDGASFERQKMYLFLICIVFVLAELMLTKGRVFFHRLLQYAPIMLGFLTLPVIATWILGGSIDIYWIRGSYEKFHGYLLYAGIILLVFSLSCLDTHEKKKLIHMSLISAVIVSIIALIEAIGVSVFFERRADVWGG